MSNTAIVHFRTLPNGGYRWIKRGQQRGYWRVLVVKDVNGPIRANSKNVIGEIFRGHEGVLGVSVKSAYCLEGDRQRADQVAAEFNAAQGATSPSAA